MIRAALLFVVLFAVAAAAAWFADHPGDLAVNWRGWRIETSLSVAGLALAGLIVLIALVYRFWLWLLRGPAALAESRARARERRGYDALTSGLVAVAAGDAGEARKLARQAEALLESPPLTHLLSAQAAQLDGDEAAAGRYFDAMLERPQTEFLALRGLLSQAMRNGQNQKALGYAERAHRARPDAAWASDALFILQARVGRWREAQATLDDATKRRTVDLETSRRRRAIALHAQALAAEAAGERKKALKLADQAHNFAPGLVQAAYEAARLHQAAGKARRAAEIIEACWRRQPHPALAEAYGAVWPGDDTARRLSKAHRLDAANPGHAEGRLYLAGLMIEDLHFDDARAQLAPLTAHAARAPRRVCKLMAALEEGDTGQAAAARDWLLRLGEAPPDPAWVCSDCGQAHTGWQAHCTACGAFDSMSWKQADFSAMLATAEAAELPTPAD